MTYMTDAPLADQSVAMPAPGREAGAMPGTRFRLRRLGARPLSFTGIELGMAMSFTPELPYWFEINLYRVTDGSFAVAIKQFFQSSEETDLARAWPARSLDEALDIIEGFDPAHDVPVRMSLLDGDLSAAEMEAAAMDLQAKVAHARTHYRSLVGQFFHALDAA
jgi:hypothetical protein